MSQHNKMATIGRVAELILGLVFMAGMLLKAYDANLFVRQILQYGVMEQRMWLEYAALGTLAVESLLAVALLTGLRLRGLTYAVTLAVLVGFTGLIAYGWIFHNLDDCGCFGRVKMTPEQSIIKNGVLALLAIVAWIGEFKRPTLPIRRGAISAKILAALLVTLAAVGYAYWDLRQIAQATRPATPTTEAARPFAQFVFDDNGKKIDLGNGEYIVALLGADCSHCMAAVSELNALSQVSDLPRLVGICYEPTPGDFENFLETTAPEFSIFSIGDDAGTFFRFLESVPPRIAYIRDGSFVDFWDERVPTEDELKNSIAKARAGQVVSRQRVD